MRPPPFNAVLKALEARDDRLDGPPGGRPPYTFGYASGVELRDEVWAKCPVCGLYGLRVNRLDNGRARVTCGEGACKRDAILEELARAVVALAVAA